jgi:4-diphosphocytidyl-2-C-methyl-D-erythritol kinase
MITYPNAKINLGLNIISKRSDGYHDINSIFYPIKTIFDILEILPSKRFSFSSSGIAIPDGKNIVLLHLN